MTRRTRRNLSDPRIRRILQQQNLPYSRANRGIGWPANFSQTLRRMLLVLIAFVLVALLWWGWQAGQWSLPAFTFWKSSSQVSLPEKPGPSAESPVRSSQGEPAPAQQKQPEQTMPEPVPRGIQVEVLNGCGVAGIASRVTRYLRNQKIDVVVQGNYHTFDVPRTFILDRIGNARRMEVLARALGVSLDQVKVEKEPSLQLDATIVIGKDYQELKPFRGTEGER